MASLNDIETKTQIIRDLLDCRVLRTITGTLPITFRSNGTALIDYRIFGTADGAGVQTENKMSAPSNGVYSANRTTVTVTDGVYHIVQTEGSGSSSVLIDLPEFEVPDSGYINYLNSMAFGTAVVVLRYNSVAYSGGDVLAPINRAVAIGSDYAGKKVNQIQIYTTGSTPMDFTIAPMITDSSTYTSYIPYGYKLPLTVTSGTENKDTDIYIGGTKLLSSDYVDYESGKIVRNGTPQDPPIPLPEINLYIGINTLDSTETLGEVTIKGKIKEVI